jgi:Tfp pilus assembly protein PilE
MKNINLKKAAMFGLDARIALAIFGALSVISGAALYSAIQNAKITAALTEIKEIDKAFESYYLDTSEIPVHTAANNLATSYLVENTNNAKNWNGPYLSFDIKSEAFIIKSNVQASLHFGKDNNWGNYGNDSVPRPPCTTMDNGETCSLWISRQFLSKSVAEGIDRIIDGDLTIDSGNVRLWCDTTEHLNECSIYVKSNVPAPI